MNYKVIRKIYIDKDLKNNFIEKIKFNAKKYRIEVQEEEAKSVFDSYFKNGSLFEKDTILIYRHNGKFLSSCPGSDGMVCCQYYVINFGVGCIYDCHYCYLQNFMNHPLIIMFGNIDDLLKEVKEKIENKKIHFRIGTGEYTDSLALDPLLEISPILINFFAKIENATLELKTKSKEVDHILDLNHNFHTVLAWSLNPQKIIDSIEPFTASLKERLESARKVQNAGYKLAFHFDPLIYYEDWETDYKELVDKVFDIINPDKIAWISLGTFRYSIGQKEVMQKRFLDDNLTKQELVKGNDNKYRYYKEIRYKMYKTIKEYIQSKDRNLFIYLCMETQYMWKKAYNFIPESSKNLDLLFEKRRNYIESNIFNKV